MGLRNNLEYNYKVTTRVYVVTLLNVVGLLVCNHTHVVTLLLRATHLHTPTPTHTHTC